MTNLKAKDLIKRLCNHATKLLSSYGINIDVIHNIVIDFSSVAHDNVLYIVLNNVNKIFFCTLSEPMLINNIAKMTKCYLFDDSLDDNRIDWCLLLDNLIKNAGAYVEIDHPNKSYWQAKIDAITNMTDSEYQSILHKYANNKAKRIQACSNLNTKFHSLLKQAVDDMQYHAPAIKISLVPPQITNVEELMIWLDIYDV